MNNVWITSDTHFSHKNIVRGTTEWSDPLRCRDFDSIKDHNNALVDGINKYVKQDDTLYHLGDWSFGGIENIWEFRKRVLCKNIYLCLGNHDHHIRKNKELPNVQERVVFSKIDEQGIHAQLRNFPREDGILTGSNMPVYAKNVFSSVDKVLEIKVEGHYLFLSHYKHHIWNGSHKGVIHLYGHSHDTVPDHGKSMDVGVDVAYRMFGEYRPFKFQEIQKIMAKRAVEFVDHHNEKTNWR